MKNILSLFIIILVALSCFAQTATLPKRICATTQYQNHLNKSYSYQAQRSLRSFQRYFKNVIVRDSANNCNNIVTLPIAIHFYGIPDSLKECARQAAINQIETLNDDFAGTNKDIANWEDIKNNFPDIELKKPCFNFQIANANHPPNTLQDGELAIIFNDGEFMDFNPIYTNYINFYSGEIANSILGYSPLGGWGNGDGVAIGLNFFSSIECGNLMGGDRTFNLGRTATHEVGHYLLLDHIWGEDCAKDDGVMDTPNARTANYDCPSNTESCGSVDLSMNYMDYTNDACMYMFSAGQVSWMDEYVFSDLDNIIQQGKTAFVQVDTTVIELDSSFNDTLITVITPLVPNTEQKSDLLLVWLAIAAVIGFSIGKFT